MCSIIQDSTILRSINEIIDLINRTDPGNDGGSTCDSLPHSNEKLGGSKLVHLLAKRLDEIRNLRTTKDSHRPKSVSAVPTKLAADVVALSIDTEDMYLDNDHGIIQQITPVSQALYKRPIVNVAYARLDTALVKAAAKRLRWDTCDSPSGGDIFWFAICLTETGLKEETKSLFGITYKRLTINRFADIQGAARKTLFACLTDIYTRYTRDDPHLYSPSACPKTYLFPRGNNKVVRALRSGVPMILKPSAGSMGNGIKVITSPEQIPQTVSSGSNYICQVYIARPMLLGGCKFDFRIYVLITNVGGGFHALLSRLGIVRICTRQYQPPDSQNCSDPYIHLTNYSINRHHDQFRRSVSVDDSNGHKRTLGSVLETLKANGMDINDTWNQITTLSESAVSILYPIIEINSSNIKDAYSFQIIGLDMLLDESGKMWLLEVNANPSLQYAYSEQNVVKNDVVDHYIKVTLVEECLKLVHKMRCGYVPPKETDTWIELRVRIPPELGEITALYMEYKSKYPNEDMDPEEWLRFCRNNQLLAFLRDTMANETASASENGKITLQEAKTQIRNLFNQGDTHSPVKGFPEFLQHMEALATYIFRNDIHSSYDATVAPGRGVSGYTDVRKGKRDHHNVQPAACLRSLLAHMQFFRDFRD
ncbi:tubulin-tyrosine ligase family protein [Babesia ovis]|uniref:Tubulin-tyrosine ligase family protein n=1 Tax=Babesia ovis TaxID=5869 RepID=A0A9W5T925_BABOV|nr:tubulin-tyrosine ligase family protein [Babesia ovis]